MLHEPRADELRFCRDCRHAVPAAQLGWHGCTHKKVIETHPDVLANWQAGYGEPFVLCANERRLRRPGTACGVGGKLWEPA